jgi:MFS superfamily sulfate permease-like transporter
MNSQEILKELALALIISIVVSLFIALFQGAIQNVPIYVSAGMIGQIGVKYRSWQRGNG